MAVAGEVAVLPKKLGPRVYPYLGTDHRPAYAMQATVAGVLGHAMYVLHSTCTKPD